MINSFSEIENIELVHSGDDYFYRLENLIHNSKIEIYIQIYLFEYDSTGKKIILALKEAASRNVKIYILLDAIGSFSFPSKIIDDLEQIGINFRFFSPLFSTNSFHIGRRLHHKVVVVDAKTALIGGINIADKYHGTETETPWLDYAVQLNGKIAEPIQELCRNIYLKKERMKIKKNISFTYTQEKTSVNIIQNDWLKNKNEIYNAYIKSIRNAKKEIIILGSYFLPGRRLTNALKKASQNNVKIKLILSGISDVNLSKRATYYIYSKLLGYNIELYEWDKSVLHGKAAVVDGNWTTIGSFNHNNLSTYGSIEMNVEINSVQFCRMYKLHLYEIITQCQRITPESIKMKNSIFSHFMNWLSYWTSRLIIIIITYLTYKRFKKLQ